MHTPNVLSGMEDEEGGENELGDVLLQIEDEEVEFEESEDEECDSHNVIPESKFEESESSGESEPTEESESSEEGESPEEDDEAWINIAEEEGNNEASDHGGTESEPTEEGESSGEDDEAGINIAEEEGNSEASNHRGTANTTGIYRISDDALIELLTGRKSVLWATYNISKPYIKCCGACIQDAYYDFDL